MTRYRLLLGVVGLLSLMGACGSGPDEVGPSAEPAAVERLSVYTVNYPLAYFAERIGGDRVEVVFPAPAGVDPAYWSPDAEAVAAYQAADLILLNGADYAKWVSKVSLPASRMVDTSATIGDRLLPLEDVVTHTHGPTGEHSHTGWAFTTWLDPAVALEQARAVRDALAARLAESGGEIEAGFGELESELRALDAEMDELTTSLAETPLLFSHPVYQYLAARLELDARSLDWEPGEMPDNEAWEELSELLEFHPARWMIWEAEPPGEIVNRLEALGLSSVVFEPCAGRPVDGDWLSAMRRNVESLREISASS